MVYENNCYECGHMWISNCGDEPCPKCGETDNVGTDEESEKYD